MNFFLRDEDDLCMVQTIRNICTAGNLRAFNLFVEIKAILRPCKKTQRTSVMAKYNNKVGTHVMNASIAEQNSKWKLAKNR